MTKEKSDNLEKRVIVRQEWTETERGWGMRPDGYSLHKTVEECKQYINDYWEGMPHKIPDEYSFPSGKPYTVDVDKEIYQSVIKSSNGIRRFR
ncbi:MAG: hypothetical protein KKF46_02720 [Nanoarchaeota archaeon]|nr:hypothetical protein [Nanoarchaeota archaeon]MBU1321245.1 hypothetical protein [Nanoarchaeota archaeon]MBU1596999.1 hypothetical protein [Nanoarchaeota archaeon]MBU2441578.1 hypothetical protein [Nanoarchaeota archaeon]